LCSCSLVQIKERVLLFTHKRNGTVVVPVWNHYFSKQTLVQPQMISNIDAKILNWNLIAAAAFNIFKSWEHYFVLSQSHRLRQLKRRPQDERAPRCRQLTRLVFVVLIFRTFELLDLEISEKILE
jgi:hypothetical protein